MDDAERLRLLWDEREIRNVLASIGRTVDDHDFDATAALYAEDGELVTPWGGHRGRDGLAEHIRRDLGGFPALHHVVGPALIDVAPDRSAARARMSLIATHVLDDAGTEFTTVGGHYDIRLVRRDDGWRLHRVEIHPAWRFDSRGRAASAGDALS